MRLPLPASRTLPWAVPVLSEAAALGRSVVFAWMLGAEELGQAMILALTLRLVEMASDLGMDRLILQAPDGNTSRLQAELQGLCVLRGLAGAALLILLAPLFALLFADGPGAATYASLALIPLLRGLTHMDFRRAERNARYRKMALTEGGATLVMVATLLPAALLTADHRAICIALAAHAAAHVLISHLVAQRPYRLAFTARATRRILRFGAPLILNALLMFATFYADRVIVAQFYDWTALAIYGIALQLALLPAQIVGRAANSLVLPRLRRAIAANHLPRSWHEILNMHLAMAGLFTLGFAAFSPFCISLVYGTELRPDLALVVGFGIAAGFRILRTPYSMLAVAVGRTGDPARANLLRATALIAAAGFAALGLPLAAIGAAAALGEAAATLRAVRLARTTLHPFDFQESYS